MENGLFRGRVVALVRAEKLCQRSSDNANINTLSYLRRAVLSQDLNFAALITVQADKSKAGRAKAVTPQMIQGAPNLLAAVGPNVGFIGISSLREETDTACRSPQFLNVRAPYGGKMELVPVVALFQRQRFGSCR